jgi:hypothetical protein
MGEREIGLGMLLHVSRSDNRVDITV